MGLCVIKHISQLENKNSYTNNLFHIKRGQSSKISYAIFLVSKLAWLINTLFSQYKKSFKSIQVFATLFLTRKLHLHFNYIYLGGMVGLKFLISVVSLANLLKQTNLFTKNASFWNQKN